MSVTSIGNNYSSKAVNQCGTGSDASSIEHELQKKKQELSQLKKKQDLSKDEQAKKQELEQQIMELEQLLQKIKAQESRERLALKSDKTERNDDIPIKEKGKGEYVDELV